MHWGPGSAFGRLSIPSATARPGNHEDWVVTASDTLPQGPLTLLLSPLSFCLPIPRLYSKAPALCPRSFPYLFPSQAPLRITTL